MRLLLYICLVPLFSLYAFAQQDSVKSIVPPQPPKILKPLNPDTVKPVSTKPFVMKKSPMGAVVRSLIFPGWGQLYVESYWKAPLATGAAAFMGYLIYDYNKKYTDYSNRVKQLTAVNPNDINIYTMKQYREYYRDNRDMSAFYLLAVYVIAAVDCYADAHLYDFSVDDKLSFGISPDRFGGVSLKMSIRLK